MISRRMWMLYGGALCADGLFAQVPEGQSVVLELPELLFAPGVPVVAAVNTTGFTSCQVEILDPSGKAILQSRKWRTEPNVSNVSQLSGEIPGRTPQRLKVRITMEPTNNKKPSVGMAMTQGPSVDQDYMKQNAKSVRFVKDPAQPPGGHFEVLLKSDASLTLSIRPEKTPLPPPIYLRAIPNLAAVNDPVPIDWDLQGSDGKLVPSGRYLATLIATPIAKAFHPLHMCSYFGVITK